MNRNEILFPVMKKQMLLFFRLSILFIPLCWSTTAQAGNELFNARVSGASIVANQKVWVKDDKYAFMVANPSGGSGWKNSFDNAKITNRIKLFLDPYDLTYQSADWTMDVTLQLTYETWDDATNVFVSHVISPVVLSINYSMLGNYKDKAVYQYIGGNLLKAKISEVKINGTVVTSNTLPVVLEGEIEVERHYAFNVASVPAIGFNDLNASSGDVDVYWNFISGAEEYELEWTYVNNYAANGAELPTTDIVFESDIFRHNSTRIRTTEPHYKIPLVYERGYLLFRVRGVGRSKADDYKKYLYTQWSSASETFTKVSQFPTGSYYRIPDGHQKSLNWQYNISYAEQGKSKVVVSYFDGSLRNRQSVTRMNTKDQVIVGETIYDYQGRPAVQVLPVPVGGNSTIEYKPDFNLNVLGKPYTKKDFDLDNGSCVITANPLDSTIAAYSASRYYSANNPGLSNLADNPFAPYIPSAEGYPFTQTQYAPDNTGRVKAQTGVGIQHQLSTGHETRYFYGKPTAQVELDRMFGTEVGDVIHYKKNMVVDPNGQVSVSYLDPQGRVIATALAGRKPDSLDNLKDIPTDIPMHADLLNKVHSWDRDGNQQSKIDKSKIYSQELLVTTSGPYAFHYKLISERFVDLCSEIGGIKNICYDCVMDLKIMLTDECNQNYLVDIDGVAPDASAITVGQMIITSMNNGSFVHKNESDDSLKFETGGSYTTSSLPIGKYTVSKVLTVNEQALDFYTEDYLLNNKCLMTIDSFLVDEMNNIDTTHCGYSCEECLSDLGSYDQYNIDFNPDCSPCLSQEDYNLSKANCDKLCNTASVTCENAYQMLLNDVTLLGQYGRILDVNNDINGSLFGLSVFNDGNGLPRKDIYLNNPALNAVSNGTFHPNWRHPIYKDELGVVHPGYREPNGEPSLIFVKTIPGIPGYVPAVRNPSAVITTEDGDYVHPEDLEHLSDFVFAWRDSWAKSLVMHHPEYPQYEYCIQHDQSHSFDETWLTINNSDNLPDVEAYLNPLGADAEHATDPFFNSTLNPTFNANDYKYMKYLMSHYASDRDGPITVWQMAHAINVCPNYEFNPSGTCENAPDPCYRTDLTSAAPTTVITLGTNGFTSKDWLTFKSIYYSLKQKVYNRAAIRASITATSYNGCIGNKWFNPWDDGFYPSTYVYDQGSTFYFPGYSNDWSYSRSQFYNYQQPCSEGRYWWYQDKEKRFRKGTEENYTGNASVCYEEYSPGEFAEVDCKNKNDLQLEKLGEKANFEYYRQCGECPIVKTFENFLKAMFASKRIREPYPVQVSCFPDNGYAEFTKAFEDSLNLPGTGVIEWDYDEVSGQSDSLTMHIDIRRHAGAGCSMKLKMKESYPIKDFATNTTNNVTFHWYQIKSICCMSYLGNPTLLPFSQGKNFLLSATVQVTDSDGEKRDEKITIEGVTGCIKLNTCPPPKICEPTQEGAVLQTLLNTLVYSAPEVDESMPAITQHLADVSDVVITNGPIPYDQQFVDSLKAATGMSNANSFLWQSTVGIGSTLTGLLRGMNSGGSPTGDQCLIEMYLPTDGTLPSGASFDDIISFNSLAPDMDNADPSHNFSVFALIAYGSGQRKYIEIKGYSPCVTVGTCQVAQKPGQSQ